MKKKDVDIKLFDKRDIEWLIEISLFKNIDFFDLTYK